MNHRQRTSIFRKFLWSYTAFVVLSAMIIGGISYFFSVNDYNREIENVNKALLTQYKNVVQSDVIDRSVTLALNVSSGVGMERSTDTLFHAKSVLLSDALALYKELAYAVSQNTPLINGIHIYDAQKQLILSSSIGLKYLDSTYGLVQYSHPWLEQHLESGSRTLWTSAYQSDYPKAENWIVTYVVSYPSSQSCIAVDVNYIPVLKDIFANYADGNNGEVYLVNGEGILLWHPDSAMVGQSLYNSGFPADLLTWETGGSLMDNEGNSRYASVSEPLSNGWRIVYLADTHSFYAASILMQKRLIIGTLLAIALGVCLSYITTVRMYRPIGTLTHWISTNLPAASSAVSDNEYAFIDRALKGMRSQLSSLTNRLEQNRELLKSNLIISLTGGTIRTEAVLERRMGLLGLKLKGRRFFALCISLDDVLTEAPNAQEVELMKLAICQQIEALTDESALYIACETRTDELTAICFLQEPDKEVSLEGLGLELLMQYQGHVCLGIGCYVDSPLKLRASYTNAQENLKYRYFHPDWLYYSDVNASNRLMPENDVLKEHAQAFAQALQEKDIERAIDEVHLFSYSAQDTVYPFAAAQERLEMLTQAMRHFSSGISEPHRLICESFLKSAANAKGLREYCYQLCVALRSLAVPASARPTVSQKNAALVDTIRQYIALNLPGDLSLTQLSEVFRLSGSYLSRIFKEAMGISILDYITSERLERASHLLVQTDQSVESIAAQVGYPTHHYFSRRFREHYGLTPKDYRLQHGRKIHTQPGDGHA